MKGFIENIKARFRAKKYDIYSDRIDKKRKNNACFGGYWLANGKLWYGHPLFVFFLSAHNKWFLNQQKNGKQTQDEMA